MHIKDNIPRPCLYWCEPSGEDMGHTGPTPRRPIKTKGYTDVTHTP